MTTRVVPRPALDQASQLVRTLSSARQVYTLYPPGHPNRVETVRSALESIRRLRVLMKADPVVFVTRHALYLGPVLLARDTLARYGLVDALEKAGIEAVETMSLIPSPRLDPDR